MLIASRPLWAAQTNTYVFGKEAGGPALIIDAPPDPDAVLDLVAQHRFVPVALLLTHGHVDHMGGAGALSRRLVVAVYVHRSDDYLTLAPELQLRSLFGMVPEGDFAPPERLTNLVHGPLDLAGMRVDVLHTPGHTPGHCCFHLAEEGILFSGDQLFAGSIGRTDLPGGSYPQLMASMREKIVTLDHTTRVLPGHGPATTLATELRTNPFLEELR